MKELKSLKEKIAEMSIVKCNPIVKKIEQSEDPIWQIYNFIEKEYREEVQNVQIEYAFFYTPDDDLELVTPTAAKVTSYDSRLSRYRVIYLDIDSNKYGNIVSIAGYSVNQCRDKVQLPFDYDYEEALSYAIRHWLL